jgi:hypothetical protein
VLSNAKQITDNLPAFLAKHQLPNEMLKISEIYTESALFVTTSFISDLFQGKTADLSTILGNMVRESSPKSIDSIGAILILSKCLKNENAGTKAFYLSFLR